MNPAMKIDAPVKVWDSTGFGYHKMHFAGWDRNGKILTFRGGKTSFSGKSTKSWENYEEVITEYIFTSHIQ